MIPYLEECSLGAARRIAPLACLNGNCANQLIALDSCHKTPLIAPDVPSFSSGTLGRSSPSLMGNRSVLLLLLVAVWTGVNCTNAPPEMN